MRNVFSLFGAGLVVLSALLLSRGYSAFVLHRREETDGFLRFIFHIKGEISRSLASGAELFRGFECDALRRVGFFDGGEGDSPCGSELLRAFERAEGRLSVSGEVRILLREFFSGFGGEYREGEIARCDAYIAKLSGIAERDAESLSKSVKVVGAILAAIALGIIIFLI